MKIILDTNVFVSGILLPHSQAGRIIKAWNDARCELFVSPFILQEIKRVLSYPKIVKRLKWDSLKINHYIELLGFFAECVNDQEVQVEVPQNSQDNAILSTLIISKADFLITGDNDLLCLKEVYPILTIQEFLEKIDL